jgi:hypothetical protein
MNLAVTPEQQRAWMAQWRSAAVALEKVKAEELRTLTEAQALRDSDDLLSLGPFPLLADRETSSGLVEQQRWFQQLDPQS